MMTRVQISGSLALLLAMTALASAEIGQYQSRSEFLLSTLGNKQPASATFWLDDETRPLVADILGRAPDMLRIRYWYEGARTAWIFDEVGKEKPITFGIAIENGQVQTLRVLHFRESRGWEIRYPFFTDQFSNVRLTTSGSLDRRIDSISGATLSVNAATRVAKLALLFDDYARRSNSAIANAP